MAAHGSSTPDEPATSGAAQADAADELTLERLYRDFHQPLLRLCGRYLADPDAAITDAPEPEAEDAAIEVILKAYAARHRFHAGRPLWPWLATIARNHCRDLTARRRRWVPLDLRPEAIVDDVAVEAEARFRQRLVAEALDATPHRDRAHLYLGYVEDWSYKELAAYDHTSVSAVHARLVRARRALRTRLVQLAKRRREWPLPALLPGPLLLRARSRRTNRASSQLAANPTLMEVLQGASLHPLLAQLSVVTLAAVSSLHPGGHPIAAGWTTPTPDAQAIVADQPRTTAVASASNAEGSLTPQRFAIEATTGPPTSSTTASRPEPSAPSTTVGPPPTVIVQSAPSASPGSAGDPGGGKLGSVVVDPGADDSRGPSQIDLVNFGYTVCPDPESYGMVTALACPTLTESGAPAGVEQDSPTVTVPTGPA